MAIMGRLELCFSELIHINASCGSAGVDPVQSILASSL